MSISGESDYRGFVEDFVPRIHSVNDVYGLFKGLGYPPEAILDSSYKRRIGEFGFAKDEEVKIANIYTVLSIEKNLNIFLVETKSPANVTVRFLRYLAKVFSDHYLRFLLIVTGDFRTIAFVLPDFEKKDVGELKLKIIRLQIDVKDLYYTDKQTIASLGLSGQEKDWRDIWLKWRDAFNVRRVTDKFFEEYAGAPDSVFFKIRKELIRQKISRRDAHEFTLQFLNRIMFVYFVAKKRWLNNEPRFMRWLWQRYLKERNNDRAPMDSFYEKWLKTIFFEAFNNKFTPHSDLPEDVNRIFYTVPYLNGGLFREEDIDKLPVKIKDGLFQEVFEFFERYNFTIREDLPFDVEVAVDPQMIGYVYESLANVAEEIYDRNDLGIFYTPRVEVDFMCRRSLVEYLHNHLPKVPKELWYKIVFDENTEGVEKQFTQLGIWYDLEEKLDSISIVDPACGSGAFLVGMLNVLTGLYRILNRNLGRVKPDFEIKKRIVGKSLYGVDVMPWAVHAAELRLWLQLVVESPLEPKDLRTYPLLPNLNMNLRVGDSLVQEIGGMTLHLRDPKLSERVKKMLIELKQEKENYINNVPTAKFRNKEEVENEEIRIFQRIIEERLQFIENEVKNARDKIKGEESQKTLSGEKVTLNEEIRKRIEQLQGLIESYNREEYELKGIRENLTIPGKKPFVWEIDFAEIFGDKNGFDIVIGNPPYVTRTYISPPNKIKSEVSKEERDSYKKKLISSVKGRFPVVTNLGKMCDYYVYFYFHGLSLLNNKGTFCFITSNSWLDVEYGKYLQEFLLKYVPILAIYDNPKRSFAHAKINTIIVLLGRPNVKEEIIGGLRVTEVSWSMLDHVAKFVLFKKPFEEILTAKNLIDIDGISAKIRGDEITELVKNVVGTEDYRVFPIAQGDLLQDGWEYPEGHTEDGTRFSDGIYGGNKWGGKYLRAPDIFYVILAKGKGKLTTLREAAEVRIGIMTGLNEFFWLRKIEGDGEILLVENELGWKTKMERKFVAPAVKSPRELDRLELSDQDIKLALFLCNLPRRDLKNTYALDYIKMGEKEKFHQRPYFRGRTNWYDCGKRDRAKLNCNYMVNDMIRFYYKEDGFYIGDNFHEIHSKVPSRLLAALCNSTVTQLIANILGRVSFGEGLIKLQTNDAKKLLIIKPTIIDRKRELERAFAKLSKRNIKTLFEELGIDKSRPIREQEPAPLPDREELDEIVFDELGLNEYEKREVYWAVCELVSERLEKAQSLVDKENE